MKPLLILALLLAPVVHAQTRVLVGGTAGSSFGNYFIGATAAAEVPFRERYELDLKDTFSPIESHISLGHGWANQATAGGHFWISKGFGPNGGVTYSQYSVSKVSKGGDYAFAGVTWRKIAWYTPARFSLNYIREFNNGISSNGVESSHLQGGQFNVAARIGCSGPVCYRTEFNFEVGHVLTQGNPECDNTSCPRAGAFAGAFTGAVLVEFPRRRGHEDEVF